MICSRTALSDRRAVIVAADRRGAGSRCSSRSLAGSLCCVGGRVTAGLDLVCCGALVAAGGRGDRVEGISVERVLLCIQPTSCRLGTSIDSHSPLSPTMATTVPRGRLPIWRACRLGPARTRPLDTLTLADLRVIADVWAGFSSDGTGFRSSRRRLSLQILGSARRKTCPAH